MENVFVHSVQTGDDITGYIVVDELLDVLNSQACADWLSEQEEYTPASIVEHALETLPTVDAVPVIRCKDCKYRDPEDKKCDCGHDIIWQLPRHDDWYCADAEREEE